MYTFDKYVSPKFLNVYVDAGIKKYERPYETTASSSGVMVYHKNQLMRARTFMLRDSTNNIGELLALYNGVKESVFFAEYYNNLNKNAVDFIPIQYINIFSDSAYSVNCITDWIRNWLNCRNDKKEFIGTNGKPVKNQGIIEAIITLVISGNWKINFIKVRGHQDPNNMKSIALVKRYLEDTNDIFKRNIYSNNFYDPAVEVVQDIIAKNNMVDKLAGSTYPEEMNLSQLPKAIYAFPMVLYTLTPDLYEIFLGLTRTRNFEY